MGQWLIREGVLGAEDVFRWGEVDRRKSYFEVHDLGRLMEGALDTFPRGVDHGVIVVLLGRGGDHLAHARPPFPNVKSAGDRPEDDDADPGERGAEPGAGSDLAGGKAAIWGQDVGHRGGVFKVTNKLIEKYPSQVRDAPINEPMIVGTAMGAALHRDFGAAAGDSSSATTRSTACTGSCTSATSTGRPTGRRR